MAVNALTVDVEEWFHMCGAGASLDPSNWPRLPSRVERTTDTLLDLLDGLEIRATFFILGYVAETHPDLVARIQQAGHEIGSHGSRHQRVYELTPEKFGEDLDASRRALAGCGVPAVAAYRAPEWSINDRSLWALEVLAVRGIRVDSSMAPLRRVGRPDYPQTVHVRPTARGPLVECPPAVERRLGQLVPFGGGWGLRMSSPARVLREIDARNRRGESLVFWVHPWELDDDPPRVRVPLPLWFAHYFRLSGFRARLAEILSRGSFGSLDRLTARETPS